ncbi:NADPH-dependent FMN reductase [Alkalicoccus chagannorensis]|uniref:NADPH-dependent FMN reductase n=1 Tax=Alkalicoccus chagannorensis TaxID=427072 RepID=UPI00042229DB|nr:NADPH-dependent FMN reductase [Alkalicoccus chagannorensis]
MAYHVAAVRGSLRKESLNKRVLEHIKTMSTEEIQIEEASIDALPLFNADLEEGGDPHDVASFKQQLAAADGILIVTPEYSHGIPGVLKNALDWAGSMSNQNVLSKKPVMLTGASPSGLGTAFSQGQLRQVLDACGAYPMPQPEIFIGAAHQKLGENGLQDEDTIKLLEDGLQAFHDWIDRLS